MAYDTKTVKRDGSGITPVPQHFNPTTDDYEPVYGRNNAGRVELYGPDGNPISADDSNKLAVRATDIETLLNDIKGKDFATQTTLAAILAKIIAAPATEAKQTALAALIGEVRASPTANTLLARLKSLEDKIAAIDSVLDAIVDGSAPAVTQLSGSNAIKIDILQEDATFATRTLAPGASYLTEVFDLSKYQGVSCQMTASATRTYKVDVVWYKNNGTTRQNGLTSPIIASAAQLNSQGYLSSLNGIKGLIEVTNDAGSAEDLSFGVNIYGHKGGI